MPKLASKIEDLISEDLEYSYLTMDQFVSYLRCGEYFRQEILGAVPEYVFKKDPYQMLFLYTLNYLLTKVDSLDSRSKIEFDLTMRFGLNKILIQKMGFDFLINNRLTQTLYSLFKLNSYFRGLEEEIVAINKIDSFTSNGVAVSYSIPLETKNSIYLISTLPEQTFLKSPYFQIPYLRYWSKKIYIVYLTDTSYTVKEFVGKDIDLRKLNSLYASYLFAYRKRVFVPIFDCRNNACPLFKVCNGMTSDISINSYLKGKENEIQ